MKLKLRQKLSNYPNNVTSAMKELKKKIVGEEWKAIWSNRKSKGRLLIDKDNRSYL